LRPCAIADAAPSSVVSPMIFGSSLPASILLKI
jgi:hypothetical protein